MNLISNLTNRLCKKSSDLSFFSGRLSFLFVSLLVGFFVGSLVVTSSAFATQTTNSIAVPAAITVNPDSLRSFLLQQNMSLQIQLNKVYQAKTQVAISRARLLPSVNLGSLISSGTSFALSSVTMLMPFLLPSNWLNLSQSQSLLNAQASAYYISQLNAYSSAYSLYSTIVGDLDLRDVLYRQYSTYKDIENLIQLAVDAGMMNQKDLLQARAQTQLAEIQVSQVDALIIDEKAAIREMLNVPLSTVITFDKTHITRSLYESIPVQLVVNRATAVAPELRQLDSLISAATSAKWSAGFGFLSGATLSIPQSNIGAFNNVAQNGTVNLGFSYFPILKLADYNIAELKLQKQQVTLDQTNLIESTMGSLKEALKQNQLAIKAQENLEILYQSEIDKFRAGMTDLLHVMTAGNQLTAALTNKVKSQIQLDTLRISLNRILIEEKFSFVANCEIKRKSDGGFIGRLGRVFKSDGENISLDGACGPQTKY